MNSIFNIEKLPALIDQLNAILSGDSATIVTTANGAKPSISKYLNDVLDEFRISSEGKKGYSTFTALNNNLNVDNGTLAEVTNDPTPSKNGLYRKEGAAGLGSWIKAPYDSFTILSSQLFSGSTVVVSSRPLTVDNNTNKLLIPKFFYKRKGGPITPVTPSVGMYFETEFADLPVSSEGQKITYYKPSTGEIITEDFYFNHENILEDDVIVIAIHWGGTIHSLIGQAQYISNCLSIHNIKRIYSSPENYLIDASSELAALGCKKVYTNNAGNIKLGAQVNNYKYSGNFFSRIFVQLGDLEVEEDWPSIAVNLISNYGVGSNPRGNMVLEKVYGPRLASFVNDVNKISINQAFEGVSIEVTGAEGRDISVSPIQLGLCQKPSIYVQPNDWPLENTVGGASRDNQILYGDSICVIEGRPWVLYPASLNPSRHFHGSLTTILSENGGDFDSTSVVPLAATGKDYIEISSDRIVGGHAGRILMNTDAPFEDRKKHHAVNFKKVSLADLATKTADLLFIGDSITEVYPTFDRVVDVLSSCSVTSNYLGTLYTGSKPREGRSGKKIADFTNLSDGLIPVDGNLTPAEYLALADDQRRLYNPFVRREIGIESTARNAYVFDYGWYKSNFSISSPTHIVINLGTNDIGDYENPFDLKRMAYDEMTIMIDSIRAAEPDTVIVIAQNAEQWQSLSNERWQKRVQLILGLISCVRDQADPKVVIAPAWAHMNHYAWFDTLANPSVDSETGTVSYLANSDVHFTGVALREYAECVAATIANTL